MALFLFAMWFLHLNSSQTHGVWELELVLHHAGIPLALFVLMQDYRFVLVDAFVRFLGNFLLAAGFTYVVARFAASAGLLHLPEIPTAGQALLFVSACLVLVLFAVARSWLQRELMRLAFPRKSLDVALTRVRHLSAATGSEDEFLEQCVRVAGDYMNTETYGLLGSGAVAWEAGATPMYPVFAALPARPDFEVLAPLRVRADEVRFLGLGRRRGGRRYLRGDLDALARFAAAVAEQLEVARDREARELVSQAELRALAGADSPALPVQRPQHSLWHHSQERRGCPPDGVEPGGNFPLFSRDRAFFHSPGRRDEDRRRLSSD